MLIAAMFAAPLSHAAAPGIDPANFLPAVAACDDFYTHANGNWLNKHPVPEAYSSWGTFQELGKQNTDRLSFAR